MNSLDGTLDGAFGFFDRLLTGTQSVLNKGFDTVGTYYNRAAELAFNQNQNQGIDQIERLDVGTYASPNYQAGDPVYSNGLSSLKEPQTLLIIGAIALVAFGLGKK